MLHDTPTGIIRVLRLTIKGQEKMMAQFLEIPALHQNSWNNMLVYEITKPIKTNHPHTPEPFNFWDGPHSNGVCYLPGRLSPSEIESILPMECVFLSINLLSLNYSSLLNSFLCKAKDPHLAAHPRNSPKTWDVTILSYPIFLQHLYKVSRRRWSSLSPHFSFDFKNVTH